jgi:DNA primase
MDAVEEVKSRLGIEDVIAEYVELKKAGRNYKGLSPFSSEKSPSFVVSPEKQIWHDFSSGKGGDMFSFVMEMEGLDFKATLELLARKAGVDLEQFRGAGGSQENAKRKERLYAASELAAKFYQVQFSRSRLALQYVLGTRQFTKETALEWQLGYSPNTGTALCDFLLGKKFTADEIRDAGLSSANRYGPSSGSKIGRGSLRDMFRGRLMIPLHDPQGRVIGFTARILVDDPQAPKYINTPQTALYDKSRHVYGLQLAKEAIRKSKFVVIAEGNLDVISSHQAGICQVVATAGTAMTEQQLKALSKFTDDIRLCYDQDKAGLNATERAIGVASKVGVSLSMITIDESLGAKDPDELIKQDPAIWRAVVDKHQYALDWLIDRYTNLLDVSSAQGKREFSDVLLPVVRGLQDSVEQDHYLQLIAEVISVRREALNDKYLATTQELPKPRKRHVATPQQVDRATAEHFRTQDQLLALALMQPALRSYLAPVTPDMLFSDQARELLTFLQQHPDFTGLGPGQVDELRRLGDYAKILSVAYEELYQGVDIVDLQADAARQQTRLIENYVKTQKLAITDKLAGADEVTTRQLLEQVTRLDQLLKGDSNGRRQET